MSQLWKIKKLRWDKSKATDSLSYEGSANRVVYYRISIGKNREYIVLYPNWDRRATTHKNLTQAKRAAQKDFEDGIKKHLTRANAI